MDDADFVRLRDGDPAIWRQINTEFRNICIALTLKNSGIALMDAEDAFQNAVTEFYLEIKKGELRCIKGKLFNYIFCIYLWRLKDICRKNTNSRKILKPLDDEFACDDATSPCNEDSELREKKLSIMLSRLCSEQRKLFSLLMNGKYSNKDIAAKLKLNDENTASQRKHYLIEKLKRMAKEEDETE
jgi:RNA polymerase sigma factor (sigma-70 family)